jgi:hypothetical protein
MRNILFILLAVISFSSCVTQKRCFRKFPPQVITKDSIVVKDTTIYRDTTITLPGDTLEIYEAIPCPDVKINKIVKSKNGKKTATVNISNGKLQVECKTDSLQVVIQNLETKISTLEKYRTETKVIQAPAPPPKIKYKVPKWCWWLLLANIGYLCWRLRKPIIKQFLYWKS